MLRDVNAPASFSHRSVSALGARLSALALLALSALVLGAGCHAVFGDDFRTRGIGDACRASAECPPGATCRGCEEGGCTSVCTRPCESDDQCRGTSAGGKNESGTENYCLPGLGGERLCFAGCNDDEECAPYGLRCIDVGYYQVQKVCGREPALYDPCISASDDCPSNTFCGDFCTTECFDAQTCGVDGRCMPVSGGNAQCFPSCAEHDCAALGLVCIDTVLDVDGQPASVCGSLVPQMYDPCVSTYDDCPSNAFCQGFCTQECFDDATCQPGGHCMLVAGGGNPQCYPACASNDCSVYGVGCATGIYNYENVPVDVCGSVAP